LTRASPFQASWAAMVLAISLTAVAFSAAARELQVSSPASPSVAIRGGRIIDGTSDSAFIGDIYVRDGRIAKVGDLGELKADRTIDATGLYVIPGFIDLHSHAETGLSDPRLAAAVNNLTQGITTVVVGQDGRHPWSVGSSLTSQVAKWQSHGLGNNIIPLVGQGSVRLEVMGWSSEPATPSQTERAAAKVREYLQQGAWGISTGLSYTPGCFSSTAEVIASTGPVKEVDGFYISHLRDQSDFLLEALDELVEIAEATGVRAVATHIKCAGPRNWGKAGAVVARLKKARQSGLAVYADLYPYSTSSDGILVCPRSLEELTQDLDRSDWEFLLELSMKELLRTAYRLNPALTALYTNEFLMQQPASTIQLGLIDSLREHVRSESDSLQRLRRLMEDSQEREQAVSRLEREIRLSGGGDQFQIAKHPDRSLLGVSVSEVARRRQLSEAQASLDLVLEGALFTQFHMSEEDVITFMKQPFVAACTDGKIPANASEKIHPRSYGAFVRRLHRYVNTLGIIDMPFAVHTGTGLPAKIIGLQDRGLIRSGYWADIVAFDSKRIRDKASFKDPHRNSEGIEWVLVNGEIVLERGRSNQSRAGRVLLKAGRAAGS